MTTLSIINRSKLDLAIVASVIAMAAMNVFVLAGQVQTSLLVVGPVLA